MKMNTVYEKIKMLTHLEVQEVDTEAQKSESTSTEL